MDARREALKKELAKTETLCPICKRRKSTDLHEVISVPMGGSKYHPENDELAALVYVPELAVLLCNPCNVTIANSRKAELLKLQMTKYGVAQVTNALQGLASRLKCPEAYIPASISFEGRVVKIL